MASEQCHRPSADVTTGFTLHGHRGANRAELRNRHRCNRHPGLRCADPLQLYQDLSTTVRVAESRASSFQHTLRSEKAGSATFCSPPSLCAAAGAESEAPLARFWRLASNPAGGPANQLARHDARFLFVFFLFLAHGGAGPLAHGSVATEHENRPGLQRLYRRCSAALLPRKWSNFCRILRYNLWVSTTC